MPTAVTSRNRRAGHPTSPTVPGAAPRRLRQVASRWRRVRARADAGSVSAELVIAMPLLLGMIMLVIQAGVFLHATHIAQAAANRAAAVAAAHGSSDTAGQQAGQATLDEIGHGVLHNTTVRVFHTSPTEVRAEIEGTAATVVPGIDWKVRAVVVRPVEVFAPDVRALPARPPATRSAALATPVAGPAASRQEGVR